MNKKFVLPLIIIILGIGVGLGLALWQNHPGTVNTPATEEPETFDPRNPGWKVGSVTAVSGSKIEFQEGPNALVAEVSQQTKLVKQVKDAKTGVIQVVDAALSDFKPKTQIVVYYSSDAKNNTYQADKIQIIQ